jgi:polyphosphate kinase
MGRKLPAVDSEMPLEAKHYINRELSWLAFNRRVLEEAEDPSQPLLERLKFVAIFGSNLDEFMMIRYAGLKDQVAAGVLERSADGMTPQEQLVAIDETLRPMVMAHRRVLRERILPALAEAGVRIREVAHLDPEERVAVDTFWREALFPVLTPLAIDAGHPFPRLPNLSFSLLLEVADAADPLHAARHAIVQVPAVLPRFFRLPGTGYDFLLLEEVIREYVGGLFPGHHVRRVDAFRITRDADIEIAEDEADDLLRAVADEVRRRPWGDPVRLEVLQGMSEGWVARLRENLNLQMQDVYRIPNHLNVSDFMELAQLPIPELRDAPWNPRLPRELRRHPTVFAAIEAGDILLHHPFHAFEGVQRLLEEAADDPDVLAIKQTLYRAGARSPVVAALARAAGNGKLVTALVELKARFDEENNIGWARELERAGVHVVYGVAGLKTHAKALLVVRREHDAEGRVRIRRYVHLGTGNYNPGTALHYTDMGLMTCRTEFGADLSDLFNLLTGFSKQREWRTLWVAPQRLRAELLDAIAREAAHAQAGRSARIIAKMNALVDPEVIAALYRASAAGVEIDLLVRGVCCLRPGVAGLSERIRVRSIVGRFLEHARALYFEDGGARRLYLGSADWMQRNLNGRVEVVFPVEDARCQREVLAVLELELRDNVKARELQPDGSYLRARRAPGQRRLASQERLMERARRKG